MRHQLTEVLGNELGEYDSGDQAEGKSRPIDGLWRGSNVALRVD
jgi:hypothetical protein